MLATKCYAVKKGMVIKMRIVAVDIGGTAIKSGIWNGTNLSELKETETKAHEGGLALLCRVKGILRSYGSFDGIGVSTAGQVNTCDGSIYYANSNLPEYTGIQVKHILEEEFHVPVFVENDVNSAALGEMYFGAAKNLSEFLCVTYGTGIGGAIVIDGKVYSGSTFGGGSFGGIVTHPEKIDGSEFSGCYEKFASVTALVSSVRKVFPELNDGRRIFEAIGSPEVRILVDKWIDEVSFGLITLIHIFNPSDIILGGGIMSQPYIIEKLKTAISRNVSSQWNGVVLHQAKLGNTAGLVGVAVKTDRIIRGS